MEIDGKKEDRYIAKIENNKINIYQKSIPPDSELHCLRLRTPCTLMLMDGRYKIRLSVNNYETYECMEIRDAMETEYTFDLIYSDQEYGLEYA